LLRKKVKEKKKKKQKNFLHLNGYGYRINTKFFRIRWNDFD